MRFTIRDMLWLMMVVALIAGWYAERDLTRYDYDNFVREHVNFKWIVGYQLGRPLVDPHGVMPRQLPMGTVLALMAFTGSIGFGTGLVVRRRADYPSLTKRGASTAAKSDRNSKQVTDDK